MRSKQPGRGCFDYSSSVDCDYGVWTQKRHFGGLFEPRKVCPCELRVGIRISKQKKNSKIQKKIFSAKAPWRSAEKFFCQRNLSQRLELVAKLETVLNMHVSGVCMSVVADPLAYLSDVAM